MDSLDKMQEILRKLQERVASNTTANHHQSHGTKNECPKCNGVGWLIGKDENGYDVGKECECQEIKKQQARYKNAMIPDEYENYSFQNFEIREDVHDQMLKSIVEYLKTFPDKKPEPAAIRKLDDRNDIKGPSFGFIATYGEQRIKNIQTPTERRRAFQEHNNFGIGKSHLTISAAKYLIKRGYKVQVVSDPVYIEDVMAAKRESNEAYHNLLSHVTHYADFVVWDDLGKLNWTEAREVVYYRIFDELYKLGKPVIFSSNEDIETLSDKIGHAAASRLKGMCGGYLYPVEGKDQR